MEETRVTLILLVDTTIAASLVMELNVVADSRGATATGAVSVAIQGGNRPVNPPIIAFEPGPVGSGTQAGASFTALPGRNYRVPFTDHFGTKPMNWQILSAQTADALDQFQIIDPSPWPARCFYRTVYP